MQEKHSEIKQANISVELEKQNSGKWWKRKNMGQNGKQEVNKPGIVSVS